MPRKKSIPTLHKLCVTRVSKSVVDVCINSILSSPIRTFISTRTSDYLRMDYDDCCHFYWLKIAGKWFSAIEGSSCRKRFVNVKEDFVLPDDSSTSVMKEALGIWKRRKKDSITLNLKQKEHIFYLIYLFFQGKTTKWCMELADKWYTDTEVISMFNNDLMQLRISSTWQAHYSILSPLHALLSSLSNLQVLDFASFVDISDYIPVIGKSCCSLQVLRGNIVPVGIGAVYELCFKDCPVNSIKNPLCDSLMTLDIVPESRAKNIQCPDPCVILLENMPKLKSLGEGFSYDSIVRTAARYREDIFPSPMEKIHILRGCRIQALSQVFPIFPNLKSVSVQCGSFSYVTEATHQGKTSINVTPIPFTPVARFLQAGNWEQLKYLKLCSNKVIDTLDFSMYVAYWPNLETLYLQNIVQSEKRATPQTFEYLYKLHVKYTIDFKGNYNIFSILCGSVKSILYNVSGIGFPDPATAEHFFVKNLLLHEFPNLESVVFSTVLSSPEKIIDVLYHSPRLYEIGIINVRILKELQHEINYRNWSIRPLISHKDLHH